MLINRCAKYICYDMTDSLAEDWMDRIAESPKLMLEIIKNLRDVHENKLHEIRRFWSLLKTLLYKFTFT